MVVKALTTILKHLLDIGIILLRCRYVARLNIFFQLIERLNTRIGVLGET